MLARIALRSTVAIGQRICASVHGMFTENCTQKGAKKPPPPVQCASKQKPANWFRRTRRNYPQLNAVASGGMNIAWNCGLGWQHTPYTTKHSLHMRICWFVAAILGSLLGAALSQRRLPKKRIFLSGATCVLLSGILHVSWPTSADVSLAARYLNGFAHGLIFAPALNMAGEVAASGIRGQLTASIEQLSINSGICLHVFATALWRPAGHTEQFALARVHGVLSILLGVTAFGLALWLTVESPVHYLLCGSEQEAVESLRRLQRPFMVTSETFVQLSEHKSYVAANAALSYKQSALHGLSALVRLCIFRALDAMTLTYVVVIALHMTSLLTVHDLKMWPTAVIAGLRWLGSLLTVFLIDVSGRKGPTLFCYVFGGSLTIAFAVFLNNKNQHHSEMLVEQSLIFIQQFFYGLSNAASATYLAEAFPLAVKPFYAALAFIVELTVRAVFAYDQPSLLYVTAYCYTLGSLSVLFFLLGIFCLPETKQTTLVQAQQKFRTIFNKDF